MKNLKILSDVLKMNKEELSEYSAIVWDYTERALDRKDALYSINDDQDAEESRVIEASWRRYYFISNHFDVVINILRNFNLD